jgi:hypothetical protein
MAIRLDAYGRFQYRIEAPDRVPVVIGDPDAAGELLRQLGVENPRGLISHAQTWGTAEIQALSIPGGPNPK